MAQFFHIHPVNPQGRLVSQAAALLRHGGVIVYPTDSCYALGCLARDATAVERIVRIRSLDPRHQMTLICRNLSEIGTYARVDTSQFRLIKRLTPGPFTFVLKASHGAPRRLLHPKRKTIGLRVPDNAVALAILESLGEPMLSTSLILPGGEQPETDPERVLDRLGRDVDLVIDGGPCGPEQTTVLDLTESGPAVVRQGLGRTDGLFNTH